MTSPAHRVALMTKIAEARAAKTPKAVKGNKPSKDVETPAKPGDEAKNHPQYVQNKGLAQSEAKTEEMTRNVLRQTIMKSGQKDPGDGVSVEALMALAHALKLSVPEQAGEPKSADAGKPVESMMREAGEK